MRIERIEQRIIQMPLKYPFETSFSRVSAMDKIIVAVYSDGLIGYGESPVDTDPYYCYETIDTCWHIQQDFLIPTLLKHDIERASDVPQLLARVRGHPMAKAGLEFALWDLEAQRAGVSLSNMLGGVREKIDSGVSIGIEETAEQVLERIAMHLKEGYRRIKIKIKPGKDIKIVKRIRQQYPDILLMVDANSAYLLRDTAILQALDHFNLLMIEQPLAYDDIIEHAELQRQLQTPICLDESIHSTGRAREALTLGSCRIINIKPARVGGLTTAREIHDLCQEQNIPVWCGGMLESGVGRALNLALASLPNFTLPGDISATSRYWEQDITEEEFVLNSDGTIKVPQGPGIGVSVMSDRLDKVTIKKAAYSPAR